MRCLPTVFGVWYNQGNALLYPFFVKYVLEEEGGLSLSFGNHSPFQLQNHSQNASPTHGSLFREINIFLKNKTKTNKYTNKKVIATKSSSVIFKKYPFNLKWNFPHRIDSSWGFWVFIFCWVDSSCPFGPWPQNVSINDIPWRLLPVSSALEQIPKSMCFGRFCQQGNELYVKGISRYS